jgi:hypothetical protein
LKAVEIAFILYAAVFQGHDITSTGSTKLHVVRDEDDRPATHKVTPKAFKIEMMSSVGIN